MPKNDLFNNFEEIQKEGVSEETRAVMEKLKGPLKELNEGQSVVNDSLNNIEQNNNDFDNTLTEQGNSQNKQRVLTKEMPGTHGVVPSSSPDNNWSFNNNVNNNHYYGANSGSSNSNNFMGGYSNTAILLSMAVLIALVFLVSTAIIMYVGLR